MLEVARKEEIEIITYSEVECIEGNVGDFKVRVRKKPRYIREELCTGCGACAEVCPVFTPSSFDLGLGTRRAIYQPFPQAVPQTFLIDIERCIKCELCKKACVRGAIDFNQEEQVVNLEVGAIIVACGGSAYEPRYGEYGYGKYANVITQFQLERMLSPSGPTGGEVVRPSDGKKPTRIVMIQCVGFRNKKENEYCSNVCCMVALKNAMLLKQHLEDVEVFVCYTDVRAYGKGYEEFYAQAREHDVVFLRGRVGEVVEDAETGELIVAVDDTLSGRILELRADLVVLSTGVVPSEDLRKISEMLKLERSPDGFMKEYHSRLAPTDTKKRGIFVCGDAQGPKAIDVCVVQAKAAAASSVSLLSAGEVEFELATAVVEGERCSGCGLCELVCPYGAISVKDIASVNELSCRGCGKCVATCPSKAIYLRGYREKQLEAYIDELIG